jgi:FdhD protein
LVLNFDKIELVTQLIGISEASVWRVSASEENEAQTDVLAIEEPLEIRLGIPGEGKHKAISITMRTPGHDFELAAGFLFTEGILTHPSQIAKIYHCGIPATGKDLKNTVVVELARGVEVDLARLQRNFYTTSSCGVCGKSSIDALYAHAKKIDDPFHPRYCAELIHSLPEVSRHGQKIFDRTGGLHASTLFNSSGEIETIREDVGRHNALDKLIGAKFLKDETNLSECILLVSGRASFELVQKALMAGIRILAAVGAPSSLAVELAREYGLTLIGFVRDNRFNIYSGLERIAADRAALGKAV